MVGLAFASAIVRYRLMDVEVIVKRSLVYVAAVAAIVAIYALLLRVAAWLSVRVAGLKPESHIRLEAALDHLGLPVLMPALPVARLLAAMRQDKKRAGGTVRWVLTPRIGDASVPRAVESRLVRTALVLSGARTTRA